MHLGALIHRIQLAGGGLGVRRGMAGADHPVPVQVQAGDLLEGGLGIGVQLVEAPDGQGGVDGPAQVEGAFDQQDDADAHDQSLHGAEGIKDHDASQHHAEQGQQDEPFPAGVAAAAQLQGVLQPAQAVEYHEQPEYHRQDPHHDIAAQDQKAAQAQTHQPRDQGEGALEYFVVHRKIPDQLDGGAGQHHPAQGIADDVQGHTGHRQQKDAQSKIQQAHQDQVPFQIFHRDASFFAVSYTHLTLPTT